MKLTLYYAPVTCALVPYVSLLECGATFDVVNVNTRANAHRTAEFLAINPKHKVPVLAIDAKPLTENLAIQVWIDRQFPAAQLLPRDPEANIQALSLMSWFSSGIHPHLTPNARPENYCDLPNSEESVRRLANKLLREDFALADEMLTGREWFFDHFTACDAYFFWCLRRAISFGIDCSEFDACMRHFDRVQARSSVQKVLAHEKQAQIEFAAAKTA